MNKTKFNSIRRIKINRLCIQQLIFIDLNTSSKQYSLWCCRCCTVVFFFPVRKAFKFVNLSHQKNKKFCQWWGQKPLMLGSWAESTGVQQPAWSFAAGFECFLQVTAILVHRQRTKFPSYMKWKHRKEAFSTTQPTDGCVSVITIVLPPPSWGGITKSNRSTDIFSSLLPS